MKDRLLLAALGALGASVLFLGLFLGETMLRPADVLAALLRQGDAAAQVIVWEIRLPRALAAFLVGAALGGSGASLQGLLRNPLADPGILGVSATASLAATAVLYFGLSGAFIWALPLAAVGGAIAATLFLALAAARTENVVALILVGAGLSSFSVALMALLMNLAPNPFSLSDLISWMLGSVANRSLEDIALAAPFLLAGGGLLALQARALSALTLGEEAASSIGLDLQRAKLAIVLGAGLVIGGAVSLAGAIGFVGLVAPHIVRPFTGHDPARTLVPAALFAGALLVGADLLVRILPTSSELKLGVVAALVGAPAFIWIALQRGRA